MKKKSILKASLVVVFVTIASYGMYSSQKTENSISNLVLEDVEAQAYCEIVRGGKRVLECTGLGSCSKSYMGHTLICTGTQR